MRLTVRHCKQYSFVIHKAMTKIITSVDATRQANFIGFFCDSFLRQKTFRKRKFCFLSRPQKNKKKIRHASARLAHLAAPAPQALPRGQPKKLNLPPSIFLLKIIIFKKQGNLFTILELTK
jgi:hypothetical protein